MKLPPSFAEPADRSGRTPERLRHVSLIAGAMVALLVLAGNAWLQWRHAGQIRETARYVAGTHDLEAELNRLQSMVLGMESGSRGFVLSGDASYLKPFESGLLGIPGQYSKLTQLIRDPAQREVLRDLRNLIDQRIAIAQRTVTLRRTAGFAAAQALVASGAGEDSMDRIRSEFERIQDTQTALLMTRLAQAESEADMVPLVIVLQTGLGILLLGLIFALLLREAGRHRRSNHALAATMKLAQEANAAKDAFLSTMSHELRTPLNGLLGMLELFELSELDGKQRETLAIARDSGRGMVRIIDDYLDLTKIEAGKLQVRPEPVSIAVILRQVVNSCQVLASTKALALRTNVDSRISPAHLADALRLGQVLGNFVSNAIRFTDRGGVEVRAELLAVVAGVETIRLSVRDSGIGMSPDAQARLFEPFEQANWDTTRLYGGTGLGLAISRRLVEIMGGSIAVESAPDAGTTISATLALPVAPDAARAADSGSAELFGDEPNSAAAIGAVSRAEDSALMWSETAPAAGMAAAPLVLAVDDHPVSRLLIERQLQTLGMRVRTATDGDKALALWRHEEFAMLVTDCNMPEMDGYTLARSIRRIEAEEGRSRMPIVACTANVLPGVVAQCQAADMDDVIAKPTALSALRAALSNCLLRTTPFSATGMPGRANDAAAAANSTASAEQEPAPAGQQPAPEQKPPARVAQSPAPAIDRRVLRDETGDDEAFALEMLRRFRACLPERVAQLETHFEAGDLVRIAAESHRFRGAAAIVGASALTAVCADIESAAEAGDRSQLGALRIAFALEARRALDQLARECIAA